MSCKNKVIASEYVSYGHPDKVADQISDAILDALLEQDPNTRAGIETMVKDNIVVLGGEINSNADVNYDKIVRNVYLTLPYPKNHGLYPENIKVINLLGQQSQEIHQGVDKSEDEIGAGDQGFCVGYASNETETFMPLGFYLAKKICQCVASMGYLGFGPDTKSQVIVEYDDEEQGKVVSILVSTMHQGKLEETRNIIKNLILDNYIGLSEEEHNKYIKGQDIKIDVNPCGEWRTGGSVSDCGVTGRKIVVDQYGGYANVGGGAFSGKDFTKIDRSAAYMARYIAKNIIAAGLADHAKVELSYMIGVPEPSSINIELNRNQDKVCAIKEFINDNVKLTPISFIKRFNGQLPRFKVLARNGHFGVNEDYEIYPWEKTDIASALREFVMNE